MRINDPEIQAIADLYRSEFLGENVASGKGGLVGKELVSALVTACMSKWFELTAKFRSRPEVYDVAEAQPNEAYNVMKMTPGADVRDDAFEAISKATNDITKELNRLFGSDVFEPRISRLEGKLEALVAFTNAKGGVFQAKGEPSEGHTVIHLTMPKEQELERAFSAMTDQPAPGDLGNEFDDVEGEPIASNDPAPDYDPDFDVPGDADLDAIDSEYDDAPTGDPLDDLTADEADAMFDEEDDDERLGESFRIEDDIAKMLSNMEIDYGGRFSPRLGEEFSSIVDVTSTGLSDFETLRKESLEALTGTEQIAEFFGRPKSGRVRKHVGGGEIIRFINKQARETQGDMQDNYELFLLAQLPEAVLNGSMTASDMYKVSKADFMQDFNQYFDPESYDWDNHDVWPEDEFEFEIPAPDQMRKDLLELLAGMSWNPVSFWAEEMLASEMQEEPVEMEADPLEAPELEVPLISPRREAMEKGFRVRVTGPEGDKVSQTFKTEREAEQFRRRNRDYKEGTVEPVTEACDKGKKKYKSPAEKYGKKKKKTVKEEAPAVSVTGAKAAGSSPSPDVIKDVGKKKKKTHPLRRFKESFDEIMEADILDLEKEREARGGSYRGEPSGYATFARPLVKDWHAWLNTIPGVTHYRVAYKHKHAVDGAPYILVWAETPEAIEKVIARSDGDKGIWKAPADQINIAMPNPKRHPIQKVSEQPPADEEIHVSKLS